MTKQDDEELCMLLFKLLADMNDDDDEIYNRCDFGFTFAGKEL